MALTSPERDRVWEGLYNSEVRGLYFAHLSSRYQKQSSFITWCSLFLSGGAAASFASTLKVTHPWVPTLLALITAGLSGYSLVAKKERKGIDSSSLSSKYAQLGLRYDLLYQDPMSAVSASLPPLEEKRLELSQSAHTLANSRRLMAKSEKQIKLERGLK